MNRTVFNSCLLLTLLMAACTAHKTADAGKITDHIKLTKDTSISYCIYLPEKKAVLPIAFIYFDPHASGVTPVSRYQSLADSFGIVLIGNNNSSNDLPLDKITTDFGKLLQEVKSQYHLPEKNIALWGFSGGAKVAQYCSKQYLIPYCIYGGAITDVDMSGIELLGFNGRQDMNYTDLLGYASSLGANPKHFQIEFAGKHEWPDTQTAADAFRWLLLRKMQSKEIKPDETLIRSSKEIFLKNAREFKSGKDYLAALRECSKAVSFLNGLTDISDFKSEQAFIVSQPEYSQQIMRSQQVFSKESEIRQGYQVEFFF
jgi:hypothetical protein